MGRTAQRIRVRSEDDIVRAVQAAREAGGRVRAVGSGGSKNGINATSGATVHLDLLDRAIAVRDGVATVEAGMRCSQLQTLIGREGLALPTVGEWQHPTIGGALATGTHGGSARYGILSSSVRNLRIVTGAGEVVEVSRGDPDFDHVGVSLGALGIVSSVTLQCVPRFSLKLETDVIPFDHYLRDPVAQESRSEFHSAIWVPTARRVIRFAADRTADRTRADRREQRFGNRTAIASFLSRRLHLHAAVSSRNFRRTAVGDCAAILSPIGVSPQLARSRVVVNAARLVRASELAIPASRAGEALARLDRLFRAHRWALNNPIGLRMTAGDGFSLSPCFGRDTLWVDLFYDDTEPFVTSLRVLAEELEARCHWGKKLLLSSAHLRGRFPRWSAFQAARARYDPDGVLANRFTDELGLTGAATTGCAT